MISSALRGFAALSSVADWEQPERMESRDNIRISIHQEVVAVESRGSGMQRLRRRMDEVLVREIKRMGKLGDQMQNKRIVLALISIGLVICACQVIQTQVRTAKPNAVLPPISRQRPKTDIYRVVRLDLPGVSSQMWESHPAIDPITKDLWFVRSDASFSRWRMFVSRCNGGTLEDPVPSPLGASGLEADPYFSRNGRDLYYISSRASGSSSSDDLDIWHATRKSDGEWFAPEKLPDPVNSRYAEWFPRQAIDGWLYFGSRRAGGFGRDDIWRARKKRDGIWIIENLGPEVNTAGEEYEFLPSEDGSWALLSTDSGLYRVGRGPTGWGRRVRLGGEINANGSEIGPMFLGVGEEFLFSRDAGTGRSGELFLASKSKREQQQEVCSSLRKTLENALGAQ